MMFDPITIALELATCMSFGDFAFVLLTALEIGLGACSTATKIWS